MTPDLCANLAFRFYSFRWRFLAASLICLVLLLASFYFLSSKIAFLANALAGPLIISSWGMVCICTWFHPEHGNLQPSSKFIGKLPNSIQAIIRWYASIFIGVFILSGLIAWPVIQVLS